VSPNDRDRARDKRRYEKRQSTLVRREAEARRNKQVIGVVVAILVVIAGFVGLSLALRDDTPVALCDPAPAAPTETRTGKLPDKATAAGKTFVATVTTNCGVITMELDGTKAPQTVASFIGLAKSGYFAGSPCHRLTTEGLFVLQCGDPTGTGTGGPGYGFGVENVPADFSFPPGTLAMARSADPESNGSQFFIVYKQTVLEDPTGYSIFGRITKGLDIVDKIAARGATAAEAPNQPISILTVDVAEKKA